MNKPTKPNLKDYAWIRKTVQDEFKNFKIKDPGFTGGRFQTTIEYVFAHVNGRGKLSRIEINKPGGSIIWIKM